MGKYHNYDATMTEVVSVDKAGRIVIPQAIRKAAGIDDRAKLLITSGGHGRVALVGNEHWAEELLRYAEAFRSETATWLASALLDRARLVRVAPRYVKLSAKYVTTPDVADVIHAATCLQEHAILITNDRHFDRIRDEGIVEVWSIAQALRSL